jgi:hypothetical protein
MLQKIDDINEFKKRFKLKFEVFRLTNHAFNDFLMEILANGTAYVVGGFIRDIANGAVSRDLDMIVDINQKLLEKILKGSELKYSFNRMSGVKISMPGGEVDLWTIDNNWAFKTDVVNRNENYIIERIADGCFFNYDSLVINVNKGNFIYVRNYNECVMGKTLDILRKNDLYKKRNPTVEANILKAFFLAKKYELSFSENCTTYLARSIINLKLQHGSALDRLETFLVKYPKYSSVIANDDLFSMSDSVINHSRIIEDRKSINNQQKFNF